MARVLICCSRTPYPPRGGGKLRMYFTAKLLASEHDVDLFVVDEEPVDDAAIDHLNERFGSVELFSYPSYRFYLNTVPGLASRRPLQTHYFEFAEAARWIRRHAESYDVVFANHVRTTEYVRSVDVPTIVDLVDAISMHYAEGTGTDSLLGRAIKPIEAGRLRRYERQVVAEADHAFVISETDRRYIDGDDEFDHFEVLPNGVKRRFLDADVDANATGGSADHAPTITFLGKMNYAPNVDAATFFAEEVLPDVRSRVPDAEFVIVGTKPTDRVRALAAADGVTVTGFVEDPIDYLARSTVFVAPMRQGAGVQNKVLEAMALGLPVVTTPLGKAGIDAEPGAELEVAVTHEFADAVVALLGEPERRAALGRRARERVRSTYTWERIEPRLLGAVARVLENGSEPRD